MEHTAFPKYWHTEATARIVPDIEVFSRLELRRQDATAQRDADGRLQVRSLMSTPSIDEMQEIVEVGAFKSSLEKFMERPRMLAYHDMMQPVGNWTRLELTEGGLSGDGFVSSARPDIQQLVIDGVLDGASIGFFINEAEYDEEMELFRIKDLELIEVSLVPIPANRDTFVEVAKAWTRAKALKMKERRKAAEEPAARQEVVLPDLRPAYKVVELLGRTLAEEVAQATKFHD